MNGLDFVQSLPPDKPREAAIIDAIRGGHFLPPTWAEVRSRAGDHEATFFVSTDALQIGDNGTVRISVSARTHQLISDMLDCVLPTTRICDLIFEQSEVKAPPHYQSNADSPTPDPRPLNVNARVLEHHQAVEQSRRERDGLLDNAGKYWVAANALLENHERAANYGWHAAGAPLRSGPGRNGRHPMYQSLGTRHPLDHVDYSQTVRLVRRICMVDGAERDILNVYSDPRLAPLVSDEGVLHAPRLPAVPFASKR